MKRLVGLLFIVLGSYSLVFADDIQDLSNIYNSLLPDFQKLTPEASALGQYGKYNASGYTGVPEVSIPLFTVGTGNFSMPVALNYDASGIKVEQQATYVGLGWNLMMGGSITQIVGGQNDFQQTSYNDNFYSISNLDLLQVVCPDIQYISAPTARMAAVSFPAIPTIGTSLPYESDRTKYDILRDVSNGSRVPDIFKASFCGHNVSFVINTLDKTAKIISHDATNYDIELTDYSGTYPHGVIITDDYGIKYYFSESPINSMEDRASYNLTVIRNAAGQRLAEFRYSSAGYNALLPYYETIGKNNESYNLPIASDAIMHQFINRNYPNSLAHGIIEYYPDTIITDKEIVTFYYSNREDIINAKKIDSIKVCANNSIKPVIKRTRFSYDYFTEDNDEMALCNRYGYSGVYGYKRLKLTNVSVDDMSYSFEYDETVNLPSRLSMKQDFWGYYNNQQNANGLCASPEYKCVNNNSVTAVETVGSANRYASERFCKVGMLNKIIYPTGGYSTFDYEIHHFDDVNGRFYYPSTSSNVKYSRTIVCGSGWTGSGYKDTEDSVYFEVPEPITVNVSTSSPYYESSSQYYKLSLGIYRIDADGNHGFSMSYTKYNSMQDYNESLTLPAGHYVLTSKFDNVTEGLIISGNIMVSFPPQYTVDTSIADNSGKSIGGGLRIKTITNYDYDNTLIGTTRYRYNGGKLLIPTVRKELIEMKYLYATTPANPNIYVIPQTYNCSFFFVTSSPTYPAICSLGCPNVGYSEVTKENHDKNGILISYDVERYNNEGYIDNNGDTYFNMFSVNMDGRNGQLSEVKTYSGNNVLMRNVSYSYTTLGANPSLNDMVFFPWSRSLNANSGSISFEIYFKYSLYPKYPIATLPCSMTETTYNTDGYMGPITTTYLYDASNYQPSEISKSMHTGSNTDAISTTRYWYPDDTEVSVSNTASLTGVHNISERVKAVNYRNGYNIVGGYRNEYETLPNSLPVVAKNFSITPDGNEREELRVTNYDEYGNIREYTKKDGTPVTIIWSYNHQCPILEIVGKMYSEVEYAYNLIHNLENDWPIGDGNQSVYAVYEAYLILASELPNAHITAFMYAPDLKLSGVIQPNGYTVYYQYDNFGKLISSSDDNGVIQRFYYNFMTNN